MLTVTISRLGLFWKLLGGESEGVLGTGKRRVPDDQLGNLEGMVLIFHDGIKNMYVVTPQRLLFITHLA